MRKTEEELAEQESCEAAEYPWYDQSLQCADPAQVRYNDVDWYKDHCKGDHESDQDGEEHLISPTIRDTGEAIASQGADKDLSSRLQESYDSRIDYAIQKRHF